MSFVFIQVSKPRLESGLFKLECFSNQAPTESTQSWRCFGPVFTFWIRIVFTLIRVSPLSHVSIGVSIRCVCVCVWIASPVSPSPLSARCVLMFASPRHHMSDRSSVSSERVGTPRRICTIHPCVCVCVWVSECVCVCVISCLCPERTHLLWIWTTGVQPGSSPHANCLNWRTTNAARKD